jgi:H3 lysine-79-specific histone-lysine N-methyltransferase
MSIFNQKSKFKVKTEIRTVRQAVAPKPKPPPPSSSSSTPSSKPRPATSSGSSGFLAVPSSSSSSSSRAPASRHKSASPLPGERSASRKRALPSASRSPASPSPLFDDESGDDDVDDDWEALDARKRRKGAHAGDRVDLNRQLCHPKLGAEGEGEQQQRPVPIIHAVDVASVRHKCQPVLGLTEEEANIRLQYPGTRDSERYVPLPWMGVAPWRLTWLSRTGISSCGARTRSTPSRTS